MPSTSKKQARFMAAAAHDSGFAKKAGISQSVAKEFNSADATAGVSKQGKDPHRPTPAESRKKRYDNPRHVIMNKKKLDVSDPLTGAVLVPGGV